MTNFLFGKNIVNFNIHTADTKKHFTKSIKYFFSSYWTFCPNFIWKKLVTESKFTLIVIYLSLL